MRSNFRSSEHVHQFQIRVSRLLFSLDDYIDLSAQCTNMLQASSPSKHNAMLGKTIPHPKSTNFNEEEEEFETPASKRAKTQHRGQLNFSPKSERRSQSRRVIIPDSDADSEDEVYEESPQNRRTDLESALPPIETDKQAIEAYEAGVIVLVVSLWVCSLSALESTFLEM